MSFGLAWGLCHFSSMLTFHPKPGTLLMCDFDTGFKAPEMVKKRPVVVISPRRRRSSAQLYTVVPLSTTAPNPVESFHHRMSPKSLPVSLRSQDAWAKCDMLYTVSLNRLDRVRVGKSTYSAPQVLAGDLDAIRRGVIEALKLESQSEGLASLTRSP